MTHLPTPPVPPKEQDVKQNIVLKSSSNDYLNIEKLSK
jgi:hypothetical protein